MATFTDDDAPPATLTTDEEQDDDVDVQVGDLGDLDDLAEADDDDDMRRADYARVATDDDIDDDFLSAASPPEAHRHQFGSALAQLPPPKDNEHEITATGEGFDYLYDSPASSPRATASSTALIMASTSSTTTVGPLTGPSPKGAAAGAMNRRALNRNPFTGLSNQGATCYMNSLLQTMFMTPELRLGLYRWTFMEDEDENEEDNIPFQLQKLFAKLQMNTQESISTKALTKSFGWTGADVFQQHDVQELCRVLFDALEKSFKGTEIETLVNDLYQGTMKDYVQCRTCGYESSRNDEFLDLSLVIRPFGSSKMMKSIEEAIEFFLKPELLNGDNQWMCDRCKTKRDAIKGLKFSKLPYLLSLQLKRFDYDYMTDSRVKLHDQVTFPKYLDMNSYLHDEEGGGTRGSIARKMSMERHELESRASFGEGTSSARDRRMSSMDESQPVLAFSDNEGLPSGTVISDTWSPNFDLDGLIEKTGPYVYELYSVLIHSGSALGGHYYAYIKSFENDKWYDFNDSNVSELSENEVKKAWGGNGSSSYGGRISYSTCAYMLMYRQVNRNKNVNSVVKESIPEYLVERMREEDERQRRQELERIELAKKILIKFYMKTNSKNKIEKSIHVYKTATLREALALAHETFKTELQGAMPSIENTRIRLYNDYTGLLSDTYEGREDKTLQQLQMYSSYQLYLETKKDNETWESHDPTRLQLFVRRFNLSASGEPLEVNPSVPDMSARYVQVEEESTIGSLTELLSHKFDVSEGKKIRLVRKTGTSYTSYNPTPVKILNPDESPQTLSLRLRMDLHLVNGSEIFFEECDDLCSPSIAAAHFEREINMIDLNIWFEERLAETIRIDRRKTLRELKEVIAMRLNLSANKFKILRGNNRASLELKNIDTSLVKVPIGQGSALYIVEGTPLAPGEYLFRLLFLKSPARAIAPSQTSLSGDTGEPTLTVSSKADGDEERDLFDIDEVLVRVNQDESELEYVTSIKAGEEHSVDSIRQTVWSALKESGKILDDNSVTPKHIRLRDVQATTLTTILVDGCYLKEASTSPVYEGRGMVAQILPEPEDVVLGHRLLQVVYLDRSKWRFCKRRRFELIIPKDQVGEDASTDEEDEEEAGDSTSLAISTVGQRGRAPVSSQVNTWAPEQIAARLTIPPEQARFAVFTVDQDSFDICELFKTDFDTWERCMANLRDRQYNYQLLVFVADADVPTGSFSLRERSSIQDFLVKKRDDSYKTSERSYSNYSNYRKPKEAALVIRTKTSKKGGSSASSTDNTSGDGNGGVKIRTPTQRRVSKSAASDTDEDDEVNLYD